MSFESIMRSMWESFESVMCFGMPMVKIGLAFSFWFWLGGRGGAWRPVSAVAAAAFAIWAFVDLAKSDAAAFAETEKEGKRERSEKAIGRENVARALRGAAVGKWARAADGCAQAVAATEKMGACRKALREELEKNGTGLLLETEAVLEDADRRVRSRYREVLDFMAAASPDSEPEARLVENELAAANEENREILEAAQSFLVAATEYFDRGGATGDDVAAALAARAKEVSGRKGGGTARKGAEAPGRAPGIAGEAGAAREWA